MCHKRSVVSTLLRRAKSIPWTRIGKRKETKRVKAVLRDNNYPSPFINSCKRALSKLPRRRSTVHWLRDTTLCAGHFVQDWSSLKEANQSRLQTIENCEQFVPSTESPGKGWPAAIWDSLQNQLHQLQFCILRSNWKPGTEHKKAVCMFDHESKISCHVHENNHKLDFGSVRIVGHESSFHVRLFLEACCEIS